MKDIFTKEFLAQFHPLSVYVIAYEDIPKAQDSKVKPIRKDVRKGKKQACSAQGKAKGKETGKATIHQKASGKSRPSIRKVHTGKRRKQMRTMRKSQ